MLMLAEILDIPLDALETREQEWEKLKQVYPEYPWKGRNYVDYDFFTEYFKTYIDKIVNKFGPYKDLIIQYRQLANPVATYYSHIAHKDAYRNSCIVIPFSQITDPICFFSDAAYRGKSLPPLNPPLLMSFYSQDYAVLMDTQVYHNVLVIDKNKPRVFLQINYDESAQQFYNPEVMKLLK